jgi:hypothetical protein
LTCKLLYISAWRLYDQAVCLLEWSQDSRVKLLECRLAPESCSQQADLVEQADSTVLLSIEDESEEQQQGLASEPLVSVIPKGEILRKDIFSNLNNYFLKVCINVQKKLLFIFLTVT